MVESDSHCGELGEERSSRPSSRLARFRDVFGAAFTRASAEARTITRSIIMEAPCSEGRSAKANAGAHRYEVRVYTVARPQGPG
eukprot:scaffold39276_cov64-Phaeocystis_antarctica.AAC.1